MSGSRFHELTEKATRRDAESRPALPGLEAAAQGVGRPTVGQWRLHVVNLLTHTQLFT